MRGRRLPPQETTHHFQSKVREARMVTWVFTVFTEASSSFLILTATVCFPSYLFAADTTWNGTITRRYNIYFAFICEWLGGVNFEQTLLQDDPRYLYLTTYLLWVNRWDRLHSDSPATCRNGQEKDLSHLITHLSIGRPLLENIVEMTCNGTNMRFSRVFWDQVARKKLS